MLPAPRRLATVLLTTTGLALAAACSSKPSSDAKASSTAISSTPIRIDLDGDGTADSIAVPAAASDTGRVASLTLRMSRAGTRTLADSGGYAPAPEEFNGNGNLVASRLVYVADFARAGRLLFLFGGRTGCCQQGLTVYRLGDKGPESYFRQREFFVDRSPVPNASTPAMIAGRALSQASQAPSSEFVSSVTYAPVVAWRLLERPTIDSALTRTLTREELGGFAGYAPRTDVAALRRANGGKVVWDLKRGRAIP